MIHPLSFSIPASKIVLDLPEKKRRLSRLVPGDASSYIYDTEESYYQQYQESLFGKTMKKAGWDCMRHYEILANGCIPYFPDLSRCPPQTMTIFPKDLVLRGNQLFEQGASHGECLDLAKELLEYTRTHLTTTVAANLILKQTVPTAKRILFLSGSLYPDYLSCLTLHGLKTLPGIVCDDVPKVSHLYTDMSLTSHLYGRGYTYTRLLDPTCHDSKACEDVVSNIQSCIYDLVIYGNCHRGMPHYELVMKHYSPFRVVLLDGEDIHTCNRDTYVKRGHPVFVREL